MPINAGPEYMEAELAYQQAVTPEERLAGLKKMLTTVPKHKGSEKLVGEIKKKIAKLLEQQEKQRQIAKRTGRSQGIKKEGSARVCIIGTANSGKSSLLAKITNAKPRISEFPFTTTEPEVGVMDYVGIKIQIIELPAIVPEFLETERGSYFASLMKESTLLLSIYAKEEDRRLVRAEMKKMRLKVRLLEISQKEAIESVHELAWKIWKNLGLIKVYTKQLRKAKDFPPIALEKGANIRDLAEKIHKDFVHKFKFARVYGKSVRFNGQQVGLHHILADDDVVELHARE